MNNIYEKVNIDNIKEILDYPLEFIEFCRNNNIKYPKIISKTGKALSAMLNNPNKYFDRDTCNMFINKFNIKSKDSIQLFNKIEQYGIKTSKECGKYYIIYPYCISNKYEMRKNFKYNGTDSEKNIEIDKIKSTILNDYINVSNNLWQLGHINPESFDNTNNNLVLQPPIQSKYRDKYIFIDTITKIPTPKTIIHLYNKNKSLYTKEQLKELKDWLNLIDL
jgi:hypothetical protein